MGNQFIDNYGHQVTDPNGPALASGAGGTTAAGTIVPVTAGAGAGSTTASVVGNDRRGNFNLVAAGTPAAGKVATVFFAQQYATAPAAVIISAFNSTDSTIPVNFGVGQVTQAKFDIYAEALTAGKTYNIQYEVIA